MAPRRTVNDVVDDIGLGAAQVRLVTFGGGVFWVDGTVTTLCFVLAAAIAAELDLHPFQRASLAASLLGGKMCGNYANVLNDRCMGRRIPILAGYVLATSCALAASLLHMHWQLACCWAFAGFGLGFACPALNALLVECSPTNKRMLTSGISHALYPCAALIVFITVRLYSPNLELDAHWRNIVQRMLVSCALLFAGALLIGFVDSPHVSLAQGQPAAARMLLEIMRAQNGRPEVSVDFDQDLAATPRSLTVIAGLSAIFAPSLRCITAVACLSTFALNYVGYGAYYSMPIVLPTMDLGLAPALILCFAPAAELAGNFMGTLCSGILTRRAMILTYLCITAVLNAVLCFGLYMIDQGTAGFTVQCSVIAAVVGIWLVVAVGWLVVYVYAAEVFPTICRGFACGFVLGCGRLGSITAPFAVEHLRAYTGTYCAHFGLVCGVLVINALLIIAIFPETRGRHLEDALSTGELPHKGELEPLKK